MARYSDGIGRPPQTVSGPARGDPRNLLWLPFIGLGVDVAAGR